MILRYLSRTVLVGHEPLLALVLAILVTAAYGGLGPGLLATLLSMVEGAIWLFPPFGTPDIEAPADVVLLGLLCAVGLVVTSLSERRRRALVASLASERALRESQRRAEVEITERRRAEEKLREATAAAERDYAKLEAVIASMGEGLAIIAPDGAVMTMNRAALQMHGAESLEDFLAIRPEIDAFTLEGALVPPEEWPSARAVRGERISGMELRMCRRDTGREWFARVSGAPVHDREGQRLGAVLTFADVTEAKRSAAERELLLESERAARAALERAGRMKDEFLATLSHELRTPLTAILGWTHILGRAGRTAEQVAQGIEVIERNARVQTQLIEDLLDVSRIVSGKLRIAPEPVDLAVVIEAAVESCGDAARTKGITVEVALAPHRAPVEGDPARLQQVVWNLVSNAVKFTPKGGHVTVSLASRGDRAVLTVRDTGQGIAPDFLPHVFDRFRQADSSTTRQHSGLGLGLAIVKHLIDMHGGEVRAESAGPGQGATVIVELPLVHRPVTGAPGARGALPVRERAGPPATLRGVSVLVVDDEPDARDLARRFLEERDATVLTAASAEEALTALALARPDVLVSDISMPGMDGYALLRMIRAVELERGRHVPAVAMTAFARPEDRDRALAAGFEAHLPKPIVPDELLLTVARLSVRGAP